MRSIRRKGYFMTFDALIAIGVVVVGIVALISYYSYEPFKKQPVFYSNDIMDTLSGTRIFEINEQKYTNIKKYKSEGWIKRFENTILEQVVEFASMDEDKCPYNDKDECMKMAQDIIDETVKNLLVADYSYRVTIKGEDPSEDVLILEEMKGNNIEDSVIVVPSSRLISYLKDDNTLVLKTVEVIVWQ